MRRFTIFPLVLVIAGCATTSAPSKNDLLASLQPLCGKAFAGRIVSPAAPSDEAFTGKALIMHVRECDQGAVRIPFHVADDRSRTWVISRNGAGLRLKHDHRHADGSEDRVTQYGGDSMGPTTSPRVEFPADAFTKTLLQREGNVAGINNVWAVEHRPGIFAYELRRPNRFFRVEFDLNHPINPPPPPWGG